MLEFSRAGAGHDGKLLSAAAAREMLTPQAKGMGLSLVLGGSDRTEHFSHGGRNRRFDATMIMYTRTGQGAVIALNGNNNDVLVGEVLQSIAREYQWPDYKAITQSGSSRQEVPRVADLGE
jgi:hypothetical protein